jgi:hypothetical protein
MIPSSLALKGLEMNDQELVFATLEEYAQAYCEKDVHRLMAIFVDGEGISLIGTGSDELRSGRSAVALIFERNFRDATATRFEWGWKHIAIHGRGHCRNSAGHPPDGR